jgi:DeoR family fructose operon transcriptional repressor
MYAPERYRSIVDRVTGKGRASVNDLAEDLQVTPETIRRDLSELERQGLVRRVHGGAVPVGSVGFEPNVDTRDQVLVDEKNRIAKAALAEVPEAGAIIVDAGTTTARLLSLIPDERVLTVVTNSVAHALALSSRDNITTMLLGGRVRGRTLATVDQWALGALESVYADVAMIGTNGISTSRGLTTPDQPEAAVKQAMMNSARRKVILADHSKFGEDHFAQFGNLSDVDVLITDTGANQEMVSDIQALGVSVVQA